MLRKSRLGQKNGFFIKNKRVLQEKHQIMITKIITQKMSRL